MKLPNDNPSPLHAARWLVAPVAALGILAAPMVPAMASETPPETEPASTITVTKLYHHVKPLDSEKVPAYQCPATHPYLTNENFAPGGTTLIKGVEIDQSSPWWIGVSITGWTPEVDGDTGWVYSTGIGSAWHASSVTNWDAFHIRAYRVKLHCTDSKADAFRSTSAP